MAALGTDDADTMLRVNMSVCVDMNKLYNIRVWYEDI